MRLISPRISDVVKGRPRFLPELDFPPELSRLQSPEDGCEQEITKDLGAIRLATESARKAGRYGRVLGVLCLRALNAVGLFRWLLRHRYLMPPLMIDMIGVRRV